MSRYLKENNNTTTVATGCSFLGLLQIAFIILKLVGVIGWSWVKVLIPLWIEIGIGVVTFVVILIILWIQESKYGD